MRNALLAGVIAAGLVGAAGFGDSAAQEQQRDRLVRPKSWTPLQTGWKHLKVRKGWNLYPISRGLLMHHHPYACASKSAADGGRAQGIMLTSHNVGRFLEPVASPEAAAELLAFFVAGDVVKDRPALDRAIAAFRKQGPTAAGYTITIHDHRPAKCGLRGTKTQNGFTARGVFYENDRMLGLVETTATITAQDDRNHLVLERTPIVTGPPTAWQTSMGPGMSDDEIARFEAEERRRYAEITRLKKKLAAALAGTRTVEAVRKVMQPGVTLARIKAVLGDPDTDTGSGIHIWHWYLADGTELIVGEAGVMHYARLLDVSGDGRTSKQLEEYPVHQW